MLNWLKKIVSGDGQSRAVKEILPLVDEVNRLEEPYKALSDEELQGKTAEFRQRIEAGEALDDLLPDAFAAVREAARRTLGMRHYDVQLIGGTVLHDGKIAEMKTGEGKTLVATLPLYLNALEGKGAHLVTVNDYLAKVGAGWMSPIYHYLGMSVGFIAHDYSARFDPEYIDPNANPEDQRLVHWRPCTRREAYHADITYGTNNEFGFDYLRDNMAVEKNQLVQRELHYAIVDEVDNILIDEARTPLIISGPAQKSSEQYRRVAQLVRDLRPSSITAKQIKEEGLEPNGDFLIEARSKSITLTEQGIEKLERRLGIPNDESLYDPKYYELTHFVDNALKAQFIFQRDRDYMVTPQGEVVIIDEFTGRAMPGRRWSDGLHQSVEAKENVQIRNENVTMATITFQNYFRMYAKLAGMTGTAFTEREEFAKIYNLDVVPIPTNKPVVREDLVDQVFSTEKGKFNAVVGEVREMHELGRPVLIGTTSVETSEQVSRLLAAAGLPHKVLNAKQHEREASIVAQAGRKGAITVATNMAGRGTDILLGGNPDGLVDDLLEQRRIAFDQATPEQKREAWDEARRITDAERDEVRQLGGLHIIGTERHEARRIDNQLRGRAGRQGDPGSSRFFLSMEDDLMKRFGPIERVKGLMERLGVDEDTPIQAGLLDKSIESAQTRVEGYNFDMRKHTVEFDDVMNKQRQLIYADRQRILDGEDMHEDIIKRLEQTLTSLIDQHLNDEVPSDEWDYEALLRAVRTMNPLLPAEITAESLAALSVEEAESLLFEHIEKAYQQREQTLGEQNMRYLERRTMLHAIDKQWIDYLTAMDDLRQSIGLQAFAQRDPLTEFRRQSFDMFDELLQNIAVEIGMLIIPQTFHFEAYIRQMAAEQQARLEQARLAGGSSEQQQAAAQKPARAARRVVALPNRNDPCPCGSGKKFKACHMGKEQEIMHLIQAGMSNAAPVGSATRLATGRAGNQDRIAAEAEAIRKSVANQPEAAPAAEPKPTNGEKPRKGRAIPTSRRK